MIQVALLTLMLLQQQQDPIPEAVQATVNKELGEGSQAKIKKQKDGTYQASIKGVRLSISESGELLSKREDVTNDKLPEKVLETAKTELGEAAEYKSRKLTEKGKVTFDISAKDIDLIVAEDGSVAKKDESIKVEALPQAVADAAKAKFGEATLNKVHKITEGGKTVFQISTKGGKGQKKQEATFGEDGKEVQ
jgi:hypothetical protein